MEDNKEKKLEDLIADAKSYVETRVELLQLTAVEQGSKISSGIISSALFIGLLLVALWMGILTLALYLSVVFDSYVAGFGCVATIFLVLSIIIFVMKDSIINKSLTNMFIKKYFAKTGKEDDGK